MKRFGILVEEMREMKITHDLQTRNTQAHNASNLAARVSKQQRDMENWGKEPDLKLVKITFKLKAERFISPTPYEKYLNVPILTTEQEVRQFLEFKLRRRFQIDFFRMEEIELGLKI